VVPLPAGLVTWSVPPSASIRFGDRREHLLRRHPARNQGRDPPQRGLLVGQHTRLLTDQRRTPSLTIAD